MSLPILEKICRAEHEAISRLSSARSGEIVRKGASGDLTKMIDKVAEDAAVACLSSLAFQGRLLSEEIGFKRFGEAEYPLVVLDPIDGTTNATRGIGLYSISVAISNGPRLSDVSSAAVLELPSGRMFFAEKGSGAFLDGSRLSPSRLEDLSGALAGMDFTVRGNRWRVHEALPLLVSIKHLRNLGSAALGLCYTASGALDFYLDNRGLLRVTDIAAAYLILREAGASVLDLNGNELDCNLDLSERIGLVAGNENICRRALSLLRKRPNRTF